VVLKRIVFLCPSIDERRVLNRLLVAVYAVFEEATAIPAAPISKRKFSSRKFINISFACSVDVATAIEAVRRYWIIWSQLRPVEHALNIELLPGAVSIVLLVLTLTAPASRCLRLSSAHK
jgi:hypothetical protein